MSIAVAASGVRAPSESFLPPPEADAHVLHGHFLRQAALANWNSYRLMVLIRRMAECGGHELFGCTTMAHYVELVCGVTGVAARERVRVAFALAQLPAIEKAFAKGELSYSKVRSLTRIAAADTEAEWLAAAREHTAEELEVLVARSTDGRPRQRRLMTRALDGHTTRMLVDLPAEEMELVVQALDAVRRAGGGALSASEALVYLAADSLAGEPRPIASAERYTVVVHADRDGTAWVETDSGQAPLRPEVVERLLCDCTLRLAREEKDGSFSLSRRQRSIPVVTRRAIEIRDRKRCRAPGCRNRLWVDAHHVPPWAEGGRHTRRTLLLLCTRHHQLCHDGILIIELGDAPGKFRFRTASGWRFGEGGEVEMDELRQEEELERAAATLDQDGFAGGPDPGGPDPEERSISSSGIPRGMRRYVVQEPSLTYGSKRERTIRRVNVPAGTFRVIARPPLRATRGTALH